MARPQAEHIVVIGAGSAGLMAARELGRAGRRVTILEARNRCGGRIDPLPAAEFGYRAEGGAEFIHGEAPVTHGLLREAGLSLVPVQGARWSVDGGVLSRNYPAYIHTDRLDHVLADLKTDLTVVDFLARYFPGPEDRLLRESVLKMVEGYDAADPARASVLALREEWMSSGRRKQARVAGGYVALIDFLAAECRKQGASIHFDAAVRAVETNDGRVSVRCANGDRHAGDAAILTVPLPLLQEIALPPAAREKTAAADVIGFGNVIKILLSFKTRWWVSGKEKDLSDLLFLRSDGTIPVWWTQYPTEHAVLTGWLAGPKTKGIGHLDENGLIENGLASLAASFGCPAERLRQEIVAARAIDWAKDPFARGAYSYATLETRAVQAKLSASADGGVLFAGEALHRERDMGTVEAALASGRAAARTILAADDGAMR